MERLPALAASLEMRALPWRHGGQGERERGGGGSLISGRITTRPSISLQCGEKDPNIPRSVSEHFLIAQLKRSYVNVGLKF